mmetsp:Transcript_11278/g.34576  ORF Transcript_11278/g.34576 Transcript_11278/m.34576 type:complete len:211 (-) Transcript_11278:179-811(-)
MSSSRRRRPRRRRVLVLNRRTMRSETRRRRRQRREQTKRRRRRRRRRRRLPRREAHQSAKRSGPTRRPRGELQGNRRPWMSSVTIPTSRKTRRVCCTGARERPSAAKTVLLLWAMFPRTAPHRRESSRRLSLRLPARRALHTRSQRPCPAAAAAAAAASRPVSRTASRTAAVLILCSKSRPPPMDAVLRAPAAVGSTSNGCHRRSVGCSS